MEQLRRARLREIPPVNELSQHSRLRELQQNIAPARITECVQVMLNELRRQILAAKDIDELAHPLQIDALADAVYAQLSAGFAFRLQRVVNATGIVLHTNCGRSVLPAEALQRIVAIAGGYANLELNLATGERGSRYWHVEELLCRLTGAEAAMVVNNNAAAVLLVMHALAAGQEVIVSRGELVEVGGAFRIPEVLKAGGAKLVEVGTTNKTRPSDFATAVTDNTALLLKVHTSNYRVVGFTQMVSATELVEVSKATGIPVVEDLGSGTLIDLKCWGLPEEPTVQAEIAAGMDLVTFSGDKLLGGPQAGIIVGKQEFIAKLKADQLTRALRIDKLTLTALEATLRLYLTGSLQSIPTLQMLAVREEELNAAAEQLACELRNVVGKAADIAVIPEFSQVGGGSLPTADIPTFAVSIAPRVGTVNKLEDFLRSATTPILARIQHDKLLLDVRTLLPGDATIIAQVCSAWAEGY